jgi:putative PIN family toxin of toxin-antitoxin system
MLIVIDTNVFVGACLGLGAPNRLIADCIAGQHIPLMGTALLAEFEDVLGRDVPFRNCRLSIAERHELLDIFLAGCRWTPIYFGWRPNLRDEGDNHLIELAIAGHASHIVSRNLRDLRHAELHFPELQCITPEQFLKETAP